MRKRTRTLSWLLAASMLVSSFMPAVVMADNTVSEADTYVDVLADSVLSGTDVSLEDNGGLTLQSGTLSSMVSGCGIVIENATQWNNANNFHATINNAQDLFKKTSFTVLMDVRQDPPTGDTSISDQRVAMNIGNATNSLHLLTYSGKFGYGGSPSGISRNMINLAGVEKDGWNAVAMTYEETDGGNGSVVIYVNGQKAGEVADVGFKLSEMTDLSAMIVRSFNTNYLQEGAYDNIVVVDYAVDEATAIEETAARKYAKENLPANTLELEALVETAESLVAEGFTSDELEAALVSAKELLAQSLTKNDQSIIDEAATKLNSEIGALNPIDISIKGSDVEAAAKNINGLTYKGMGMLNGNATSNLLLDYKAEDPEAYWKMMEYLFGGEYPLFTHIKMEMGNDGNNSTGAEACTMRYADDEADVSRSPGFVMAADAKKINPDVKISFLRWGMPAWISSENDYEGIYKWYRETIFDAYEKYGYVVDFVNPDRNETGNPNEDFIKWYENRVVAETEFPEYMDEAAQELYHNIRIIASDENEGLQIVPSMRNDAELYDAVDIIGFHYRTSATNDYIAMADVDDKEVWYSEGCATFGYTELQENKTAEYGAGTIGGHQSPLALVDSFITAFQYSRRTHYVFQPAIGSFYEGIQYGHKELLSARDPWSGYIHYDPALNMLEHFVKFAKTGWEDNDETQNEIWRVIKESTNSSYRGTTDEHATTGIDGDAGYMTLAAPDKSDFSVVFVNNTRNAKTFRITAEDMDIEENESLNFWLTETDNYMQNKGQLTQKNGVWYVRIPAYCVATATTLDVTPEKIPVEGIHNEDRAVLDTDADGRTNGVTEDNVLYADDFEYDEEPDMEEYNVLTGSRFVDYLQARGNEPRYMLDTHGAWVVEDGRLKHELARSVSQWNSGDPSTIVGDFRWMDYATTLDVQIPNASASVWMRLGIRCQTGMNWNNSGYSLCINGQGNWEFYRIGTRIANGKVAANEDGIYNLKMIALGDTIYFMIDGVQVGSYTDPAPMLSGRVKISSSWSQVYADNLLVETVDGGIPYALSMVDGQDDSVAYEGAWAINYPGGGSADNWYRTLSTSSRAGASFEFPVYGTGFALTGSNNGTAVFDIYVNGELVDENAETYAAPLRGEAYILTDLPLGTYDIKVVLKSGSFNLDAIHAIGERLAAPADSVKGVITELPASIAMTSKGDISMLPTEVEVETASGEIITRKVTWNVDKELLANSAFGSISISGTVENAINAIGYPLMVSVGAEIIPEGTVYFIDTVDGSPKANATTEAFELVKGLLGDQVINNVSDQFKADDNGWGLVDRDAGTKQYTSTANKTDTGIYGAQNRSGETLSYALTLPAGTYVLYSAHREWWNMNRPMRASLTANGTTNNVGNIALSGSSGDIIHEVEFTLDEEQTITYTLTATGSQAPVISWLAVTEVRKELNIVTQPVSVVASKGADAVVSVEAEGEGLTYTWYYKNPGNVKFYASGTNFVIGDGSSYSIPMQAWRDGQEVYCVITDKYGNSVQTNTVSISMKKATAVIIQQPVDVVAEKGENAVVSVAAEGENLTYTWYYKNPGNVKFYESGSDFVVENGTVYSIPMFAWRDGQQVYCVITDANGDTLQTNTVTISMVK